MHMTGFIACEHLFGIECSGEVANLVRVADRYGVLMEAARVRIEAICRQCRISSLRDQNFAGPKGVNQENHMEVGHDFSLHSVMIAGQERIAS